MPHSSFIPDIHLGNFVKENPTTSNHQKNNCFLLQEKCHGVHKDTTQKLKLQSEKQKIS